MYCELRLICVVKIEKYIFYNVLCCVIDFIFYQLFIVRFFGFMEVKLDDYLDVVYEIMRQILVVRVIYNIFRMTELYLLVICDCLK